MKQFFLPLLTALSLALMAPPAAANTDVRQWISGERTFSAELISYDPETELVTFRDSNGRNLEMMASQLSLTDQAWLKEWTFMADRLAGKIENEGGRLEHLLTIGEYPTDLFIYHPAGVEKESERPMVILFHPSGKAQRYLMQFVEVAAETKAVVVACGTFRNTGTKNEDPDEEKKLFARFSELLPQLEKAVAHDPKKIIMGGPSGGAWRAFHYSAWIDRPWLGIFSNGGWLGKKEYWDLPYPSMRVAIVNGNLDHANRVVESDTRILLKRDCEVAVFSFEGGHQTAPVEHTVDAINWILGEDDDE